MMFGDLLQYTKVADGIVIEALEAIDPIPEKAISLFSHVLDAQHIWCHRILGTQPEFQPQQLHDPAKFSAISEDNFRMLSRIQREVPMEKIVTYSNSQGAGFENSVRDILFHIINHSTYHRAQIATVLRQNGIAPPVTDYVILKRQGVI